MDIVITPAMGSSSDHTTTLFAGQLKMGAFAAPCVLGKQGTDNKRGAKREGDGKTPRGRFAIRRLWYRPDREAQPQSPLPICPISQNCAWSDDPDDPAYNRAYNIKTNPTHKHFSHERLWRDDHLYDLFLELGYNDDPPLAAKGSAIFLHLAPNSGGTQGCIGVSRACLGVLIARITRDTYIIIG